MKPRDNTPSCEFHGKFDALGPVIQVMHCFSSQDLTHFHNWHPSLTGNSFEKEELREDDISETGYIGDAETSLSSSVGETSGSDDEFERTSFSIGKVRGR